tara:strand:+ start:26099 stop:26617 length:519 start_codon:yes stop_codon:yes gene_type:complete
MLKRIQKIFLKKIVDNNLKNRNISNINDELHSIGFLVDEEIKIDFENFYEISKELGLHEKDVKIFSFSEVKTKTPTLHQNKINNKHFTWNGEIHNQNANEFLETPFDVLVGYYRTKNDYLDVMVSKTKAKFKVGFKEIDNRLFDLLIDVDPLNVSAIKKELVKYFRILNKIN